MRNSGQNCNNFKLILYIIVDAELLTIVIRAVSYPYVFSRVRPVNTLPNIISLGYNRL